MKSYIKHHEWQIIEEGLRVLKHTFRPGLRAFLDILGEGQVFEGSMLKIISALNAAESVNFQNESYALLTSSDKKQCHELAEMLLQKNQYKQQQVRNIISEIERKISKGQEENIIFDGDPAWGLALAGSVASILCNKYEKPVFIFKKMDKESCGSVRNPKGTN